MLGLYVLLAMLIVGAIAGVGTLLHSFAVAFDIKGIHEHQYERRSIWTTP